MPSRRLAASFPALRNPQFRVFFSGYLVSLTGIWIQRVAQAWFVLELTDSAFWVGVAEALGSLPVLLFSLYAGVLADRLSRYRMVLVTQAAAMVLALLLAALVLAGVATLGHVLAIAALLGIVNAFDIPARQAFLGELVGREALVNAIALNSSAFNASRVVGPAIGGFLIGAAGVGVCFAVNGLSYLAVLGALLVMRPSMGRAVWTRGARGGMRDGITYVMRRPELRRILVNIAVLSVFGLPAFVLLPVIARQELGGGAQLYGWLMSSVGVGAVTGALALAAFSTRVPKGRALSVASAVFGGCIALLGLANHVPAALLLLAVAGFAMIVTSALTNSLLQLLAPDELRGRMIAVYTIAFIGLAPLGALQAGTLAELAGVPVTLGLGGAVTLASALRLVRRLDHGTLR